MKALVIGATGIIGNHVVRSLLKRGIHVRGLQRGVTPAANLKGLDIELVKGDATVASDLAGALKGCDWLFHTAPYYPMHTFQMQQHCDKGLAGIQTLIDVLKKNPVERFVYTSSLTTIGKSTKANKLADETCAYDLLGQDPHPYFRVKYVMEEAVKKSANRTQAVIVNPTGCVGPFELKPANLCLVPQVVNRKIPAMVERPINLVDVADVGEGQVLAALKGRVGERYILGGFNTSTSWYIEAIARLSSVGAPKIKLPLGVALVPSYLSELIAYLRGTIPALPILGLRFTQYGQHLSSEKAQTELGYNPEPIEPAIRRAIEWFRQVGYC